MKVQLKDRYIYIIAVIHALLLICFGEIRIYNDTPTYIYAWENSLSHFQIDIFRTPVYPLLIGLCKSICGDFLEVVVVLQHLIFIISVFYFKRIAACFIESQKVVFTITVLYIITTGIGDWATCILTESLAISGLVFLFYNIVWWVKTRKRSCVTYSTLWLLLLVFLRPSFIYLFLLCLLLWIYLLKKDKKMSIYGISGVLFVVCLYCGYSIKFNEHYGIFSTSSVGTINKTYIALQGDLMRPEFTEVSEFKKDIIKNRNCSGDSIWEVSNYYISKYGLETVDKSINKSIKTYPSAWIKNAFRRLRYSAETKIPSYTMFNYGKILNFIFLILSIRFLYIYVFVFLYFVIILKWMITKKKILFSLFLWLAVASNIFIAVVGAQAEWGRLIAPSAPLLLIMLGQVSNYISIKSTQKTNNILI